MFFSGIPQFLAADLAVSSNGKTVKSALAFDFFNNDVSSLTVYPEFIGAQMPFNRCTAQ